MLGEVECPNLTDFFEVSHENKCLIVRVVDIVADLHRQSQRALERDNDNLLPVLEPQPLPATNEYSGKCPIEYQRAL